MEVDQWIKANVHCCSCGGSLQDSRHINLVGLDKLATWEYPRWGNILVMDEYPVNRASAILCDRCIREQRTAKYAVEWDSEHTYVRYHRIEDLKDLPRIPEEEVLRAESELYDSWEKCFLCLRTSPKRILEASHKLFPYSPEIAHKIGVKAAELLRQAYFRNPVSMCGRSTSGLIGGAMYVACLLEKEWETQREVAEVVDTTETTIQNNYRRLIRILELGDKLLFKPYSWSTYRPRTPGRGYESAKEAPPEG